MTDALEPEVEETEDSDTPEAPAQTESDDEPPAWFKKHLAEQAAKTTPPVKKTAPAKKTAPKPVKRTAPVTTETADDDKPEPKKRSGVSKRWFGNRADS